MSGCWGRWPAAVALRRSHTTWESLHQPAASGSLLHTSVHTCQEEPSAAAAALHGTASLSLGAWGKHLGRPHGLSAEAVVVPAEAPA